MRASNLLFLVVAAISFAAPAAAQNHDLVYRVDSARAVVVKHRLVISAQGAVRSGGWDMPRLELRQTYEPETRTLEVKFVARPPGPRETVVSALLPVSASKIVKLPHYGAKQIRVVGETNSVIVPITR